MRTLWRGSVVISLEDNHQLQDLQLLSGEDSCKSIFPAKTSFKFLSFVSVSQIPLHLIASGSLEVRTGDIEAEKWLEDNLVQNLSITNLYGGIKPVDIHFESDTAVLLKVDESSNARASPNGPLITELVLYASASPIERSQCIGILTPPRSSSPAPSAGQRPQSPHSSQTLEVRIYALPISSHLTFNPNQYEVPDSPPPSVNCDVPIEARFLPPPDLSSHRKRQRLDSLFDGATKQVKHQKRHGGETTAKIMAGFSSRPLLSNALGPAEDEKAKQQPQMQIRKVPKPLVRSQTADSVPSMEERQRRLHNRHHSESGPIARTRNTALQRVVSAGYIDNIRPTRSNSPTSELLGGTSNAQSSDSSSLHARNKNALSRTIMAGMRMHGLSQRKKSIMPQAYSKGQESSSRPTTASGTANAGEEDEYKLVYHQTFKAAAFALRQEIGSVLVDQERMRDIVDMLLGLFCGMEGGIRFFSWPDKACLSQEVEVLESLGTVQGC